MLACEPIALDLLVQVGARHVQQARGFRHVPVVLSELRQQERALGRVLEFFERAALEERYERAAFRYPLSNEALDVVDRDARARPESENPIDVVAQSAYGPRPVVQGDGLDRVRLLLAHRY